MKKQLLSLSAIILFMGTLLPLKSSAQTGFALSLPGSTNGANSNMRLPALNSKITGFPFTIEMWVKPSGWVSYGGFFSDRPGISASGAASTGSNATNLQFDNNSSNHYVRCDYDGNSRIIPAATLASALCNNGVWNHISLIVKADSTILELNGVYYKVGYTAKTWNPNFCNGVSTYIGWDNTTFAGQLARAVPGLFDEIRIWNTARTQTEIDANKSVVLTGSEPGLVAYYNFDDKTANDKTSNGFNGTISGGVLTDPNSPVMSYSEKNVVLELEGDLSYPLYMSCSALSYNIVATPSAGVFLPKSTFTPAEFTAGGGKVALDIFNSPTTPLAIGDTGKVVISYSLGGKLYKLDSVKVTPVAPYDRYIITNKASNLMLSAQSNLTYPVLNPTYGTDSTYLQNFILRKVHPALNDSLYYIELDGSYSMLRKGSNDWDVEFGSSGNEAVWKLFPQSNGTTRIMNVVKTSMSSTQNSLGVSALTAGTRPLDNYAFSLNPTGSPYCEWVVQTQASATDPTSSALSGVTLSAGMLSPTFDAATLDYNVLTPADVASVTVTATSKSSAAFIDNNGGALSNGTPAVLNCISGDNSSTSKYTFTYSALAFSDWAARGSKLAGNSTPNLWGWKCPVVSWAPANSTTAGTVRYVDSPAGYYSIGDTLNTGHATDTIKFKSRIMYVRWDGSITTSSVYSFPTILEGGKQYAFTGKYAWNSVIPSAGTKTAFTLGINTAADNTGTSVASFVSDSIASTDLLHLRSAKFTFTPPTTGVYYFTMTSSAAIMGAIADLSISSTTELRNNLTRTLYATVDASSVKVKGTVSGDQVKVYNVSGQLIKSLIADSDITSINLSTGVYLIKVNSNVLKVVR